MTTIRPMIIVGAAMLSLAACASADEDTAAPHALSDDAITVGSFDFPESILLAGSTARPSRSVGIASSERSGSAQGSSSVPACTQD